MGNKVAKESGNVADIEAGHVKEVVDSYESGSAPLVKDEEKVMLRTQELQWYILSITRYLHTH